ncbi:MAG: DUF4406 domain-containing protein, partial [Candidatus Omnitrophica bacterium]|nr:DUF4406 domain-containing protein [Candidatus Omnitrophota bacterium]
MTDIIAYIAGPYRAKTEWEVNRNIERARLVAARVAKLGLMFICPHLNSAHMGGTEPEEIGQDFWLEGYLEILSRCDLIVFTEGWEDSQGSVAEEGLAHQLGLNIYY